MMRILQIAAGFFLAITLSSCAFTPFAKISFDVVLSKPVTLSTEERPTAMVSADFDGDGHLDLVSLHAAKNIVVFFKGDGMGGFTALDPIKILPNPVQLQVVDFNKDGLPDLLVLQDGANQLAVLAGDRTNGLQLTEQIELSHEEGHDHERGLGNPKTFKVADFNGDGIFDLVLGYRVIWLEVFYGEDTGVFRGQDTIGIEVAEALLEAFDANRDGIDDLLVFGNKPSLVEDGELDGSEAFLFLGQDDGLAEGKSILKDASGLAGQLDLADLNNDGLLDLVLGFGGNSTLSILPSVGDGTFGKNQNYLVKTIDGLTFADLDLDGDSDIILSENRGEFSPGRVYVFLNAGDLRLRAPEQYETRIGPLSVVSGDFDENGFPDLAVIHFFSNDINLFFNQTGDAP